MARRAGIGENTAVSDAIMTEFVFYNELSFNIALQQFEWPDLSGAK